LRLFNTATQKKTVEAHGRDITEEYLDYARTDVQCTWELFVKLGDLYKQHGLTKRITDIYSEASIGKGYFGDLGVQSFFGYERKTKRNPRNLQFDPKVLGVAMEGYFGGKSMAKIRHMLMECMHGDFRSQYPSVNALMQFQDLLLAEWVGVIRDSSAEAKRWLEAVELVDFQRPETWPKLRGFARIRVSDDVLPFRAEYEPANEDDDETEGTCEVKSINVGINHIKSACDGWFSFADICASKFLTGKCPEILETVEFIPHGQQTTKIIKIFGDPNYTVDLSKDDFFVKVIELRTTVKVDRNAAQKKYGKGSPEYARLDAIQLALKLLANATSYGILVEVVVDECKAEVPCMVYHGGEATRRVARKKSDTDDSKGFKSERPGKYFAPFGGLIPAAGRLLLAIAEVLLRERGLSFMFCDTDSLCPARPEDMGCASRLSVLTDGFNRCRRMVTEKRCLLWRT
jgi:hypothetical protein